MQVTESGFRLTVSTGHVCPTPSQTFRWQRPQHHPTVMAETPPGADDIASALCSQSPAPAAGGPCGSFLSQILSLSYPLPISLFSSF